MRSTLRNPNPAWNQLGPPVPAWFRRAVRALAPNWVLQFTPAASYRHPQGVNPVMYPHGIWDICTRLPRSGLLHPTASFSLVDLRGNYQPPTWETLQLLKLACRLHRSRRVGVLEDHVDRAFVDYQRAKAAASREGMRRSMGRFMSQLGKRQWTNRIFFGQRGDLCNRFSTGSIVTPSTASKTPALMLG